ncbi:MAG: hypothetical protein ACYDHF_06850 [Candidatus Cryosericum sp.]
MRRRLLVLLAVVCVAAAGCTALDKPLAPRVTVVGVTVPALLGTYGWSAPGHAIQSDAPVPDEFVAAVIAVPVPAGSILSVDYGRRPQDLFAYRWVNHEPTRIDMPNGTFQTPMEPGTYVYSLESTWREGHASHAIKIAIGPK